MSFVYRTLSCKRRNIHRNILKFEKHLKIQKFVKELNKFYLENSALWENDINWDGFKWIVSDDQDNSVIVFRRISGDGSEIICACNFCPVIRKNYRIGVPEKGVYRPVFSSDHKRYGGKGTRLRKVKSQDKEAHLQNQSIVVTLPPLSTVYYKKEVD